MTPRTVAEIEAGARRCAHALFARGVALGDAIGVSVADDDARSVVISACDALRAVAVEVGVGVGADGERLRGTLDARKAVAFVHDRGSAAHVAAARPSLSGLRVVLAIDDGSEADLTHAGSEDFDSALAGASLGEFPWKQKA